MTALHQSGSMRAPHPVSALDNPALRLGDTAAICKEHPALTPPAVRSLIHRAKENGLAPHVYRIGRRVYLDLNGFQRWVREQQSQTA